MPVPVNRMTPAGKRIVAAEPVDQLLESSGHPGDAGLAAEKRRPRRARSPGGFRSIRAGAWRSASVIAGPRRTAGVVDLGLRQIERVLALDVARAHVVADREADELELGLSTRASSGSGTHQRVSRRTRIGCPGPTTRLGVALKNNSGRDAR